MNWKKQIMVGFGLFLGKIERIANSRSELASELCYTDQFILILIYYD